MALSVTQGETEKPPSPHSSDYTPNRSRPGTTFLSPLRLSIGALSVFIKGGTYFIPGSLGAQDGDNLFLLIAFS